MLESGTAVFSLPETICVSELTETVTFGPFSCPSFGPVQRTSTLSELLPTADTEPANQCDVRLGRGLAAGRRNGAEGKDREDECCRRDHRVLAHLREPPAVVSAERRSARQTLVPAHSTGVSRGSGVCKARDTPSGGDPIGPISRNITNERRKDAECLRLNKRNTSRPSWSGSSAGVRRSCERAGFDPAAAFELAMRFDIDLHAAIELVERGCPPELAAADPALIAVRRSAEWRR